MTSNAHPTELRTPNRKLWSELAVLKDIAGLPRLNVRSLPRGASEVWVLPGFMTDDRSTWVMRHVLRRLGHQVHGWGLGTNHGRVRKLVGQVQERLHKRRSDQKVHLVGWSLGGFLAREVAREVPERVAQVITLASPVVGGPKYTRAAKHYLQRGIDLDAIEAQVAARDHTHPLRVPVTALYSRTDAIVCPAACIDRVNSHVEHIEVDCVHFGFGFNRDVLSHVARRLAPEGEKA